MECGTTIEISFGGTGPFDANFCYHWRIFRQGKMTLSAYSKTLCALILLVISSMPCYSTRWCADYFNRREVSFSLSRIYASQRGWHDASSSLSLTLSADSRWYIVFISTLTTLYRQHSDYFFAARALPLLHTHFMRSMSVSPSHLIGALISPTYLITLIAITDWWRRFTPRHYASRMKDYLFIALFENLTRACHTSSPLILGRRLRQGKYCQERWRAIRYTFDAWHLIRRYDKMFFLSTLQGWHFHVGHSSGKSQKPPVNAI